MKLIVGLGNPGDKYKWTRHNVGFEVIDKLAYDFNINFNKTKFNSIYSEANIYDQKVILLKPLTYMNLSGESIIQFLNFYKINVEDLIVICDDVNLPLGSIRLKPKGSHGGQNGLKNIINNIQTQDFKRIRIGVGYKPDKFDLADFVLSKFKEDEKPYVISSITSATDAISFILKNDDGFNYAMNNFNKKAK